MALIETRLEYLEYYKAARAFNGIGDHIKIVEVLNNLPENPRRLLQFERALNMSDISHEALRDMYEKTLISLEPGFVIDEKNILAIEKIIRYLRHDEKFLETPGNSFDKGILLRGGVGTGKTCLMKGLIILLEEIEFVRVVTPRMSSAGYDYHIERGIEKQKRNVPKFVTSSEIVFCFNIDGFEVLTSISEGRKTKLTGLNEGYWIIDDIGTENTGHHYGSKINVISELLMVRYEDYMKYRQNKEEGMRRLALTHATSNLNPKELKAFYGDRIYDRMRQLFNDIILDGGSRRK